MSKRIPEQEIQRLLAEATPGPELAGRCRIIQVWKTESVSNAAFWVRIDDLQSAVNAKPEKLGSGDSVIQHLPPLTKTAGANEESNASRDTKPSGIDSNEPEIQNTTGLSTGSALNGSEPETLPTPNSRNSLSEALDSVSTVGHPLRPDSLRRTLADLITSYLGSEEVCTQSPTSLSAVVLATPSNPAADAALIAAAPAIIAQQARDIEVLREAAGQHMPRRADCPMCKALEATQ